MLANQKNAHAGPIKQPTVLQNEKINLKNERQNVLLNCSFFKYNIFGVEQLNGLIKAITGIMTVALLLTATFLVSLFLF